MNASAVESCPSALKKTVPITATPVANDICWTVLSTPDADPASCPLILIRMVLISVGMTNPCPVP